MYYKTSLEWFLIAFLLSIYDHVSTDKNEKNIAIIFNPSNFSSDFYLGHFDYSTKLYASLFFIKSNTGLLKVILNFIYY